MKMLEDNEKILNCCYLWHIGKKENLMVSCTEKLQIYLESLFLILARYTVLNFRITNTFMFTGNISEKEDNANLESESFTGNISNTYCHKILNNNPKLQCLQTVSIY